MLAGPYRTVAVTSGHGDSVLFSSLIQGMFHYTEYPLNHSMGIPFSYKNPLEVIMKPHQRGFLILWNQTSILVSSNSGRPHPVQASSGGAGHRLGTPGFSLWSCAHGGQRRPTIAQLKQNTISLNLGLADWSGSPRDPPVCAFCAGITNHPRLLQRC